MVIPIVSDLTWTQTVFIAENLLLRAEIVCNTWHCVIRRADLES